MERGKNNFTPSLNTEKEECNFIWTVENFDLLIQPLKLISPNFQLIPGINSYIEFGKETGSPLHLYLNTSEKLPCKSTIQCSTDIKDGTGNNLLSTCKVFEAGNSKISEDLLSGSSPYLWKYLKLRLIDKVILIFKFTISCLTREEFPVTLRESSIEQAEAMKIVALDLKKLYDECIQTDVIIKINEVTIKAHKTVLIARSLVFARMFAQKLQESHTNEVVLEDIDAEAMKHFISLLYYPVLEESLDYRRASDLYYAADKYEVLSLRNSLAKRLSQQLNEDNCLHFLALSDRHQDSVLRKEVMKFAHLHIRSIINSEKWNEFFKTNSELAMSTIRDYFKNE